MAHFRLSRRAKSDLLSIVEYTLRTWGGDQATRYIENLEACCGKIANAPTLGRSCDDIHPGLRRIESGRHVVFYETDRAGILVWRILHRSMLPERHTIDEETD